MNLELPPDVAATLPPGTRCIEAATVRIVATPTGGGIHVEYDTDRPGTAIMLLEKGVVAIKAGMVDREEKAKAENAPAIEVPNADLTAKLLARGTNGRARG